jgi:hypothetical protein
VVEPEVVLAELESLLDRPTQAGHRDEGGQGRGWPGWRACRVASSSSDRPARRSVGVCGSAGSVGGWWWRPRPRRRRVRSWSRPLPRSPTRRDRRAVGAPPGRRAIGGWRSGRGERRIRRAAHSRPRGPRRTSVAGRSGYPPRRRRRHVALGLPKRPHPAETRPQAVVQLGQVRRRALALYDDGRSRPTVFLSHTMMTEWVSGQEGIRGTPLSSMKPGRAGPGGRASRSSEGGGGDFARLAGCRFG